MEFPDNVVLLKCNTRLDIPVERVLDGALTAELTSVLVIGEDEEGFYFACSKSSKKELLWLIEKCKQEIMGD
jgi:hypothetical protein